MLTICTVNAGDYLGRGREYAVNLAWGVNRSLSRVPHRIVCFTDDPRDYGQIKKRPLPHAGLTGWWDKIALFKPGVFQDGERVLYLDLDTVIAGSLDDIVAYDGEFALLEDVIYPDKLGSGVMTWHGGFGAHIFQSYLDAGCPDVQGGDQVWIMAQVQRADLLQHHYPNQIASYKMSAGVLSPYTRICCFHGHPRPHEITTGWVPALWRAQNPSTA